MRGQWTRPPAQDGTTTVVFVHGILSAGETCWRNDNGTTWPTLLLNEPDIQEVGVYVYSYATDVFSGTYRLGDVVDDLKERLTLDRLLDAQNLIFVCHSMGGLVVRKLLVERAADFIDRGTVCGLFLVASPSLGSRYADWLSRLAVALGHAQAKALRFSQENDWLQDLDKEFQNLKGSGRLTIVGKELVEDKFVILRRLLKRQVVEPFAGARYFPEHYKVPGSDHFSICKPAAADAIQHRLLCEFIRSVAKTDQPGGLSRPAASDLTVSPLSSPGRLSPLKGRETVRPSPPTTRALAGGFRVRFSAAHNGKGEAQVRITGVMIQVDDFVPGPTRDHEYRVNLDDVIGRAVAEVRQFNVCLDGRRVANAYWVDDEWNSLPVNGNNLLDVTPPRVLRLDRRGDANEEIDITVSAVTPGLYTVHFDFVYSVLTEDRRQESEPVRFYYDE
jgi:pimeloyl-ACP methyl ester carboxylesterase